MPIINHYCITGKNFNFLNNLDMDVILGGSENKNLKEYPAKWIKDNDGINISEKNKNFGTLTSHYWIWKNRFKDYDDNDWIGINHQISQYLTVDILKAYLQFMENPNFLLKIFHQHYTNDNHIDIHALVDMFDVVIILYRENLIGHYISFERAMETKVWSKGNKKYRSNRMDFSRHTRSAAKNHKKPYDNKTKIKWNINKYIRYYNKLQKSYQSFEEISRLSGKPTVVIRYEDLDKQKDKYQYVQKILDDNNIDHKLIYSNEDPVLKQSVEGLPIEDNFLNPERFIKEFSEDSIPKSLQFKLSQ